MMTPKRLLLSLAILLLMLVGAYYAAIQANRLRSKVDLPLVACEALPSVAVAEQLLATHEAERRAIEQQAVSVSLDSTRCPGRAELLIAYATTDDRDAIRALIGPTFFGLPYRFQNV